MPDEKWNDPDIGRDFRTAIPPSLIDDLHRAVGQFMLAFADAETSLNATISSYVAATLSVDNIMDAVGMDVVRVLTNGQRIKNAAETLKRLLRVAYPLRPSASEITEMDARYTSISNLLSRLADIQYLRDRIAHNGAFPDMRDKENWFGVSNLISAREFDNSEIVYFTLPMLHGAAHDLVTITSKIHRVLFPELYLGVPEHDEPFLYKPSLLKREGPKSGPNHRLRQHPPGSSQA